jgi:DNA-damage-inducible protein J
MTSTKSTLNVKIDKIIKEKAAQLLESMGLDHTTAINVFYRQIIMERRLPFQPASGITLDEQIQAVALKQNPKRVTLQTDESGNVIIDKDMHPDIYDWAVNG